jgi:hypothetical protein
MNKTDRRDYFEVGADPMINNITVEKLHLSRSVSFGGAGISIVLLATIVAISQSSVWLNLAVYCLAFSIPLFLVLGATAESHIWGGPDAYCHFIESMETPRFLLVFLGSYGALALATGLVFFHFNIAAGFVFFIVAIGAYWLHSQEQKQLVGHLQKYQHEANK